MFLLKSKEEHLLLPCVGRKRLLDSLDIITVSKRSEKIGLLKCFIHKAFKITVLM